MVSGSQIEGGGGTQIISAGVRKTIQSIKEIVGNHSDIDIYWALKETDMDPNETTQKLLNQGDAFCSFLTWVLFVLVFFRWVLVLLKSTSLLVEFVVGFDSEFIVEQFCWLWFFELLS